MQQLLIVGCGNMGGAMLVGWLADGLSPERFAVLDPALNEAPPGVALYRDVREAEEAGKHDRLMLGFKPQQLGSLAGGLQGLTRGVPLYSLLAGLTLAQLQAAFPEALGRVRVMPNLAARIGKSPVALIGEGLDAAERSAAFDLFDALGLAVWIEEESAFDLVTALAGSGPGFVYRFIDALAQAAAELGLERGQATRLALTMVDGAASLAAGSELTPGELADRVASPGGMTREGLNVLDEDGALAKLLTATLAATRDRGAALSSSSD
ncbi:pyrroline-5-carboxylate reductase family protein [Erythrobacter sp.]|jgi:pyrroline-5-carboxylate reductase|uniref:pyrroline-5-carboxylate reductase family protein n=1 Tax=Erythrobacter sp. TaxID=1042 RepID=UPI002EA8796F|nr:pyrroline-5-carboxylate reductase [Erythrobacter sp.]